VMVDAASLPWADNVAVTRTAAAVRAPLAGGFDAGAYRAYLGQVRVAPLAAGEEDQCRW
jgi:hypothetical protein